MHAVNTNFKQRHTIQWMHAMGLWIEVSTFKIEADVDGMICRGSCILKQLPLEINDSLTPPLTKE